MRGILLLILAGVFLLAETRLHHGTAKADSMTVERMAKLTGDDLTAAKAKAAAPKPDSTKKTAKPMSVLDQRNFLARRVGNLKVTNAQLSAQKDSVQKQLTRVQAELRKSKGQDKRLVAIERQLATRLRDLEQAVGTKDTEFVVQGRKYQYLNYNRVIQLPGQDLPVWTDIGDNPSSVPDSTAAYALDAPLEVQQMIVEVCRNYPAAIVSGVIRKGDTLSVNFGGTSTLDRLKNGMMVAGFDATATLEYPPLTIGNKEYTPHHVLACNNLTCVVRTVNNCPEKVSAEREYVPQPPERPAIRKVLRNRIPPFEWTYNASWWAWIRPDFEQLPDIHDRRNDQWNVYTEMGGRLPLFRSPFYLVGRVRPVERTDTNWSQVAAAGLGVRLFDNTRVYIAGEAAAQFDNRESGFYGYLQTGTIDPYSPPRNYVGEWTGRFDLTGYADLGRRVVLAGNGTYNVNRNLDQFDGSAELDVHRFVFATEGRWHHQFPMFVNLGNRTAIMEDNVFQRWYGRVGYRVVRNVELFAGGSIWDLSVKNNQSDAQESYWYHQWGPLVGLEWHAGDVRINGKATYFWRDEFHSPVDREVRADLTVGYWPGVH